MNIGILGSGVVGQALGTGLLTLGHRVKLGTRDPSKLAARMDEEPSRIKTSADPV